MTVKSVLIVLLVLLTLAACSCEKSYKRVLPAKHTYIVKDMKAIYMGIVNSLRLS